MCNSAWANIPFFVEHEAVLEYCRIVTTVFVAHEDASNGAQFEEAPILVRSRQPGASIAKIATTPATLVPSPRSMSATRTDLSA
jgi:hypothetical protein